MEFAGVQHALPACFESDEVLHRYALSPECLCCAQEGVGVVYQPLDQLICSKETTRADLRSTENLLLLGSTAVISDQTG